jgi:hypothetical protein
MFQSPAVLARLPMRTAAWRLSPRRRPKKTDDDLVNNVRAHLENSFVVSLKDQVARGKRLGHYQNMARVDGLLFVVLRFIGHLPTERWRIRPEDNRSCSSCRQQ